MVFDAFVGEQDRHEENWGILRDKSGDIKISPLYDNGCCLVRGFRDNKILSKYLNGKKDFRAYANTHAVIRRSRNGDKYTHSDLIEELSRRYPEIVYQKLCAVEKVTEGDIERVVYSIPEDILTEEHRKYIVDFVLIHRKMLMDIKNVIKL